MPESRHRYLYERLGDHDFQQLVSALLASQFSDYVPMALRQADGGRDGLRKVDASKVLIYQVKWSVSGKEKDPVTWLDQVVKNEEASLKRLAAQGVRYYTLVTNVGSTAKEDSGTFDRLAKKLQAYAKDFGYEQMTCIWREALNPWVDNAPTETKWAYAEMLAGWDLVRYLVAEQVGAGKDKSHRDLIRKVAAAQWEDDMRVKFSQSDVDREKVVDLFVDVTADRVHAAASKHRQVQPPTTVGGAAAYLLRATAPFTLVRGAPGQGKSTLSQYLCQAHRASFIPESDRPDSLPELDQPRFPIRLDLSDYALWLGGNDVWDHSEERRQRKAKARTGEQATIECFLADLLTHESGGIATGAKTVQDIFDRVPSLVVLDGLDEVGSATIRGRIVKEIDKFVGRGKAYTNPPRVVVTTRPSAGELPEPSQDLFEIVTLNQLTGEQRDSYLRKWCTVRGIRGKDGRALRRSFKEKSREPYISELAGNPMQLTILLDLLHQQGAATPTQRTDLYDKYVELLLAREANKHPKAVRDHKEELLEIIPFLGWYLHAHTEESQINGRMSVGELKEAMRHFQRTYGNRESIVDQLFEGASDRLWALTSKVDGTYEFEVLSLREYFAARFLYHNAGEDNPDFDTTTVLRELMRRPYWLNTARFYGGNAKGNGIYPLTAGIEDELAHTTSPASYLAAWALLTDGVFLRRPREARKILTALCSDTGIRLLLSALDRRDIIALPELPDLPDQDGPDPTWVRLTTLVSKDPADSNNTQRVRALRELLNQRTQFSEWWYAQLTAAVGTPQQNAWLGIGAECEAGAGVAASFENIDLSNGAAELFLSTGLVPTPGSALEAALLDAVLDGECPCVTSTRSMPAQVAAALSPRDFLTSSKTGFVGSDDRTKRRRTEAINQLRRAESPYTDIAKQRAFKAGQKGSTFPWAETASALHTHVGRRWLASEIAIIGAASPFPPAYTKKPGSSAFGSTGHPAELLARVTANSNNAQWWREQFGVLDDDLARAEWALALWCVASGPVVTELWSSVESVLNELPAPRRSTVLRAAEQIARYGWLKDRPVTTATGDPELAALNELRTSAPSAAERDAVASSDSSETVLSLLSVARGGKWLKVDAKPVYR
ncbi:large ATP-binding protein [Sanguibacter hominis ATCC BAA-789]|uniref:Large ATP-binding protein n=1 Tax=Sanguibacter hominis ATCC BAA-789 TaxID=1312740 RepID=A0A9X5IR00_9MICO|nr:large ATP-binding protein [Sanguibacter hominis]NKX92163.1 large ATP-binding protein [Sanguibacter hominis ATCC BAA-789]